MERTRPERCAWVCERLEAHLEGGLPAGEDRVLRAHLRECASCGLEADLARRIGAELEALPALRCPAGVMEAVLEQARAERRAALLARLRGLLEPLWRPAVGLAFAVLLAVLFALRPQPEPLVPSAQELARAERQARFALAYIGRVSRRAGQVVGQEIIRQGVVEPVEQQTRAALAEQQL